MSVVEAGDIDKAERMVRDAAMARDGIILNESGNPRVLYHGTNQFGFTEFAPIKAAAIWTSTARNVAANYAGDGNYASVREIRKGYSGLDTTDGIIADMEYLTGQKWRRVTDEERQNLIDDIEQRAVEICSKFNGVAEYDLPGDEEERTKAENAISWVENLFWELADAKANGWSNDDRYNYIKPSVEQYREHRALLRDYRDKYYGELSGSTKELIDYLLHWEVGDLGTVASYSYLAAVKPGDALTTDYDGSSMVTPESLRNTIQRNLKIGAYQLFGFADNILEVDCKNNAWYNLDFNGMHNTDEIAVWAKQNGYDAVHFKNLYDYGDLADDYCFFSPNQVKSADPVTYDDNGKIIPLSERFNTESDDIRFRISGENAIFAEEDAKELANDIANGVYRQISSQENSGNLATEMDSESDGEVLFRFIGEIGADRLDKTDGGRRILNLIEAKKYYTPESAENIKRAYGWELDKDAKGNPVWKYEENDFGIKDFNIKDGANLSDVIDDEGLFAAYPELKNYTLAIEDLKDSVGYFNEANKKIALEKDAEKEEARLTLIHEIQHFIQSKEGWVRGTSAKNPLILDTIKDIFPYIREDLNMFLMSAAKRIFNKSYKKESISNFRFFKDKWGFDPIEYLFDLKKTNYLAYEAYLRKAGEVEARNAERRADMTELERRRSLASETEDRPRSRQWRETPYEDVMFSVSPATQLRKKGLADSLTEEQMSSIANDAFASMDEQTRRKIAAEQIRLGGDLVQPVMDYISRINI